VAALVALAQVGEFQAFRGAGRLLVAAENTGKSRVQNEEALTLADPVGGGLAQPGVLLRARALAAGFEAVGEPALVRKARPRLQWPGGFGLEAEGLAAGRLRLLVPAREFRTTQRPECASG